MKKKKQQGSCESCMYYEYDEDYECYVCEVNLDEDEMARFMEMCIRDRSHGDLFFRMFPGIDHGTPLSQIWFRTRKV